VDVDRGQLIYPSLKDVGGDLPRQLLLMIRPTRQPRAKVALADLPFRRALWDPQSLLF